ncbi:uncharacterized protein LOC116002908 [Ipomoea triloba]|uniref:uncharacterized protein LOC116002908 n=1 Tax=Ipomoea triloba TaxID=35885 RepID=UPI00125CD769|nr:uncharacterized protein LOC116002908 [Ipomoea triloba]
MATFVREDGVSLSTTDVAPSHFMFKIQSVSLLTEYNVKKCSSAEFEAGGYKWKLIFYPNGNKRNHVTDHISVHLALMADTRSRGFQPGWEVHAVFRLFLLDRNNDTYLVIRDVQEKGRRFRATRTEWGFDRVIPVGTFNDPSYGYVVDDVCVFGAEVYVHKDLKFYTGECLSMVKDPDPVKYPWTIFNFFVPERAYHESPTFQQWKMRVYPNGKDDKGTHVSLSLHLASGGESKEPTPSRIYAEFTLRLIDRHHHKNWIVKGARWFNPRSPTNTFYEWPKLITKDYFKTKSAGFWSSCKDKCTIEAEVRVHGETTPLQS